jgi:hypothetical protein
MDLIGVMLTMFLNFSDPCHALPSKEVRVGNQDYLVLEYACGVHQWQIWERQCLSQSGNKYWGRPYFMQELHSHWAFYVNRFGELQGGLGAVITEAYLPACGS